MTKKRWRILLIEDNLADAVLFRRLLEKIPDIAVEFVHRVNAADGLATLGQGDVDCVLLDYLLGATSGLETLDAIRVAGDDVPVVILTGVASEEVVVESWRRHAQEYLSKNALSPQVLFGAISSAIGKVAESRAAAHRQQDLEQFAACAAAEIGEPLRSFASLCNAVRERARGRLDADSERDLGRAAAEAARLTQVVDAVAAYARAGGSPGAPRPMDLNAAARVAIANLEQVVTASGARVEADLLPVAQGDSAEIVEVLERLLDNAIRFRGDDVPRVRITGRADGGRCIVSVTDNGVGIAPARQGEIFRPFHRSPASPGASQGLGVSLATCRRILRQHGGDIWVESTPGEGATFHFTLPLAAAKASAPSQ